MPWSSLFSDSPVNKYGKTHYMTLSGQILQLNVQSMNRNLVEQKTI